jgi:hypothetical protein
VSTSFGKLFQSMYDGTLASRGPWQALVTMQQLIILADATGAVDMTPEAIARRTTIPLDVIRIGLAALEAVDTESRSPAEEGRRIVRLDPARSWGWRLVNHDHYRNLRSKADKAELNRRNYEDRKRRTAGTGSEVSTIQTNESELSTSQTARSEKSDSAHTEAEAEADKSTLDAARTRTHAHAHAHAREGWAVSGMPANSAAYAEVVRDTARVWTIAANDGMGDNRAVRDAYRPINVGRGDGLAVVEAAFAAGVQPDEIARAIVYRMAVEFQPAKFGDSITSLAYFRDRLIDVYPREVARAADNPVAEIDVSPTSRGRGSGGGFNRDEQRAAAARATGVGAAAAADSLGLVE